MSYSPEHYLAIRCQLAALAPQAGVISRRRFIARSDFLANYYVTGSPVVIGEAVQDWPALARWSPDYLSARLSTASDGGRPHELGADPVREDLGTLDAYLDPEGDGSQDRLRLGGDGVASPFAPQPHNQLWIQLLGRVRITLLSPEQQACLQHPEYTLDSGGGALPLALQISPSEVLLEPGDVLFVPVGWWLAAEDLEYSASLSCSRFRFPNPQLHLDASSPLDRVVSLAELLAGPVCLRRFDDEAVLFVERSQRVYRLDPTVAFVARAIDDGRTLAQVGDELAARLDEPLSAARRKVVQIVSGWRDIGAVNAALKPKHRRPRAEQRALRDQPGREALLWTVLGRSIALRCPEEQVDAASAAWSGPSAADTNEPDRALDLVRYKRQWIAISGDRMVGRCHAVEQLAPLVRSAMLRLACGGAESVRCAISASVVGEERHCVVLAGPPRGLTTALAAVLQGSGLFTYADGAALLDFSPLVAQVLPLQLELAETVWEALGVAGVDGLEALPVHNHFGGWDVCYLPARAPKDDRPSPVRALVFLEWSTDDTSSITPVGALEAVSRIELATHATGVPALRSEAFDELVDALSSVPAYHLAVGKLADAAPLVGALL